MRVLRGRLGTAHKALSPWTRALFQLPRSSELAVLARCNTTKTRSINDQQVPKRKSRWSAEEKAKLSTLLHSGIPRQELYAHFPNRTALSIRDRIKRMFGAHAFWVRRKFWTQEEDDILRGEWSKGRTWRQIKQKLPHRSVGAMQFRLRNPPFSEVEYTPRPAPISPEDRLEISRLRTQERLTWDQIGRKLGKKKSTVQTNFSRSVNGDARGPKPQRANRWSPSDIAELRRLKMAGLSYEEISARMNRKKKSIAFQLTRSRHESILDPLPGRGFWTEDEDNRLFEIALTKTSTKKSDTQIVREVANQFPGRSLDRIRQRLGYVRKFASELNRDAKSDVGSSRIEEESKG